MALALVQMSNAQDVGFRSNGHVNKFKKVDTLYFHEYAGQKPSTKTADIDTLIFNTPRDLVLQEFPHF